MQIRGNYLLLLSMVLIIVIAFAGCGGGGGGGGSTGGGNGDNGGGGTGSPTPPRGGTSAGVVSGVVVDAATGQPLPDVQVKVGNQTALTGNDGRYSVSGLQPGSTQTVRANLKGYLPFSKEITIDTSQATTFNIRMTIEQDEVSAAGRYVAFESFASNLVAGDTNGQEDVFVRDTLLGTTIRISVSSSGGQGNARSRKPVMSADGRYVVFYSEASNLVPGDTNGEGDVFLRDMQTGITTRISVSSSGEQGNDDSYDDPAISRNGRYVGFFSRASNLVPGDTNGAGDIFVHDILNGETFRVSVSSSGEEGNQFSDNVALSDDGRYVAFRSAASNLVPGDTNGVSDIFVHDTLTGSTTRVSVADDGTQGNLISNKPAISGDGKIIAFWSSASTLVADDTNNADDLFVHDMDKGTTRRISVSSSGVQSNGNSEFPSMPSSGKLVAFHSLGSTLVPGDTNNVGDIFIHYLESGETIRVSIASDGTQGNGRSYNPCISADGTIISHRSNATNLVAGDTNNVIDVFTYNLTTGTTARVSVSTSGAQGNDTSADPFITLQELQKFFNNPLFPDIRTVSRKYEKLQKNEVFKRLINVK